MDDLLLLSDIPETQDRQAIEEWLDARAVLLASLIADEILRITTEAFNDFIESVDASTVTASGDLYTIDPIIPKWQIVADTKVIPNITQTYLSGSLFAYTIADGKRRIPTSTATGWAKVVNQQAVEYAAQASNRLRNVGETLWNDVRKKVTTSIESGSSGEKLKAEIESLSNFSEYRADTIARTETATAYSNGNWTADQALGEFGPVEKIWVAVGDARTRPNHFEAMSASTANPVPFNEPFTVGGVQMMFPHSPGAPAAEVVNCRCYYETYYEGDTRPDGTIVKANNQTTNQPTQIINNQTQARMSLSEWSSDEFNDISSSVGDKSAIEDKALLKIANKQGFTKRPTLISDQEFNRALQSADSDFIPVYRGINGNNRHQYVQDFKTGEYFAGKGMFGNGTYTTTAFEEARSYTVTTLQSGKASAVDESAIMKMLLPKSAKIADDEVLKKYSQYTTELSKRRSSLLSSQKTIKSDIRKAKIVNATDDVSRLETQLSSLDKELRNLDAELSSVSDFGRYAAMQGYDAIQSGGTMGNRYFIILNRGTMRVVK